MTYLLVFLYGFTYDLAMLWWIRTRNALVSALASILVGLISVLGMSEVIQNKAMLPALLLGYGVGSYVVTKIGGKS